ncbi:MAG: hypothetical protein WDN76_05995 [Alphaproteobacteria bacterium]
MADEPPAESGQENWEPGAAAPAGGGDAIAAGWSMSGDGSLPPGALGAERVLNQDEIDSLLGFANGDDAGSERTGVRALINSALVSYERLPMLEVVLIASCD